MSDYVPKVGDIVTVTLRDAKVIEVDDRAWRTSSGALGCQVTVNAWDNGQSRQFFLQHDKTGKQSGRVTVELERAAEPPKPKWPTTPGSIIAYAGPGDSKYVRLPSGKWWSLKWKDESTDADFEPDLYEVLFDAGAPR